MRVRVARLSRLEAMKVSEIAHLPIELRRAMQRYDFEVLKNDSAIAAERSVTLRNLRAAWPLIARLARTVQLPGCQIRVTDQSGAIVILVGVESARRYFDPIAA